nr:autocrine proliferation repressor protein A-like [Zootoca vivipara]
MYAAFFLLLLAACLPSGWAQTALDDYVKQDDPHYNYTVTNTEDRPDVTIYTLNMTSLKWLNESELSNPIWWHELIIVVSKERKMNNACFLMLGLGRNDEPPSKRDLTVDDLVTIAKSTGSCAALLGQIANQPITFKTIPLEMCKNSIENAALVCSWWRYMNYENLQPHVLIQFPMVKAAVRGMDTVADFMLKESGGTINITKFTLTGFSKRGWVTWLTAGVDKRVVSFIPIIYDLLNIVKNWHHEYRSYCGWGVALYHFYVMNITRQLDTPRFQELASHVDPFVYKERYQNRSLLMILSTGDDFFLPDNSYYFFDELPGKKYIRFIPNTNHMITSLPWNRASILESCRAFHLSTMQNLTMPQISWNRSEANGGKGIISLYTDQEPLKTRCIFADTWLGNRRDFRQFRLSLIVVNPVLWTDCKVVKVGTGVYKAELSKPLLGWKGFFIEVTFKGPEKDKHVFTSEVQIIPDTFPCADCKGEGCYGKLV